MATLAGQAADTRTTTARSERSAMSVGWWRIRVLWSLGIFCLALLPYAAAIAGTPDGSFFRGSLRPSTDAGMYLTALRLGAEGEWLWHDPLAVHAPPAILMYPTYNFAGHVGALFHVSPRTSYIFYHAFAVLVLFGTVWRLASLFFKPRERRWFTAFAFCASGLYWLDALLDTIGRAPVSLTRMGMENLSGFSLGLIVGHQALGIAGHLMALTALLVGLCMQQSPYCWWYLLYGAAGTILIGFAAPVFLPLTFMVLALFVLWWVVRAAPGDQRLSALRRGLLVGGVVGGPGVPFALYYYFLFNHGTWKGFQHLSPLNPLEGLLTWGVLVPLGIWGWRMAPPSLRPLATILALWCMCAICGTALNLYQGSRLTTGVTLPIGGLFAMGLMRYSFTVRRHWLEALSVSLVCQYLFLLTALLNGNAKHLYNNAAQEQALQWLALHGNTRDVVLAPFFFGNVATEASPVRVVAGGYDQTYDFAMRYPQLQTFFGASSTTAERLHVLRATSATLVVYDGHNPYEGPFDPQNLPGLRTVFVRGDVAILRVPPGM
jgi:hypothetical protein